MCIQVIPLVQQEWGTYSYIYRVVQVKGGEQVVQQCG